MAEEPLFYLSRSLMHEPFWVIISAGILTRKTVSIIILCEIILCEMKIFINGLSCVPSKIQ